MEQTKIQIRRMGMKNKETMNKRGQKIRNPWPKRCPSNLSPCQNPKASDALETSKGDCVKVNLVTELNPRETQSDIFSPSLKVPRRNKPELKDHLGKQFTLSGIFIILTSILKRTRNQTNQKLWYFVWKKIIKEFFVVLWVFIKIFNSRYKVLLW